MAANFWTSNHCKGLVPPESLNDIHPRDYELGFTQDQVLDIVNFYTQFINDLAKSLKLRQRVVATAVVYLRRFYSRNPLSEHDPRVVSRACLYVAAKAEECTVQVRNLRCHMDKRQQRLPSGASSGTAKDPTAKEVLDYELRIMEELDYSLVVFHPYRPLSLFAKDARLPSELVESAWAVVNDMYFTNLPLAYAPHTLALGAIYTAAVVKQKDIDAWMSGLNVDMDKVYEVGLQLLEMYGGFRGIISQDECHRLMASAQARSAGLRAAAA